MPKTSCKPLPIFSVEDAERFHRSVDTAPGHGPNGDCWIWKLKAHFLGGYGAFRVAGESIRASRAAWKLAYGEDPYPWDILHKCDNPACCNPIHLFKGNKLDNSHDAMNKGRLASGDRHGLRMHPERAPRGDRNGSRTCPEARPRGESHYNAAHNIEEVIMWRQMVKDNPDISKSELARRLGVNRATFSDAVNGRKWKEIQFPN